MPAKKQLLFNRAGGASETGGAVAILIFERFAMGGLGGPTRF